MQEYAVAVVEAAKEWVEVAAATKVRAMQVVVVAMDMVKVAAKQQGRRRLWQGRQRNGMLKG